MKIAADIAARIAGGEFKEGSRISGRTALSSRYQVSSETVRKALKVLADVGIVSTREGSGSVVLSASKAKSYLEAADALGEQQALKAQLKALFQEYTEMGQQILTVSGRLMDSIAAPLPADQAIPNYETVVPADSDKCGMTLGELRFWQYTGATVAAIRRGQSITLSPGPYAELRGGDVLIYVGHPSCRRAVEQLLGREKTERTLFLLQEQVTRAVHAEELEIIARVLGADLGEVTGIRAMTKGMTNRSFVFRLRDRRYILRIPGEGTEKLIDRRQEADCYQAVKGLGICRDPVYLNPENGLMVTVYLENARTCNPYDEADLVRAVGLLKRLHKMDLKVGHTFPLFEKILFYEELLEGRRSAYKDYEETKRRVFALRPYIEAHASPFCLTHMDAVPDNFLFSKEKWDAPQGAEPEAGSTEAGEGNAGNGNAGNDDSGEEYLCLTDWEYAAMQDPHLDIAMFAVYSDYERRQTDHLIDLYFSGKCPEETRIKIYCYIAAAGLLWSNWCEYKRMKGVEFGSYAEAQYRCAKTYLKLAEAYGAVQI